MSCSSNCCEPVNVNVPGPEGPGGGNGTNGTDGLNAFSSIVGGATLVPAYGATATVELTVPPGSLWVGQGQTLYVQSFGYFRVDAIPDDSHVTLFNLGYTGNINGNGILTFAAGARVQPGGLEGPAGSTPGGVFLVANNLSEGTQVTMRANLGLGALAVLSTINNALWSGAALAVANGGTGSTTAVAARTALGLGDMAVQAASAVAITGGALNGTLGGTTPAAANVTAFGATGVSSFSGAVTFTSQIFTTPSTLQSLFAGTTIAPNAPKIRVVGNGAPILMGSTPTITPGTADGQLLIVQGTNNANTVELQDDATLLGSQLHLGATSRVLGKGDSLLLSWDATDALWNELAFSNLV